MPFRKISFAWAKKRSKKPTITFADLSENDRTELKSRGQYVLEEELKLQTRKYIDTDKFDDLVEGLLHLSTLTCIYADSLRRCNENGVPAALKNTNRRARLNHLESTDLVRAEIETEAPPTTVTAPVTDVEEPPATVTAPVTEVEEPPATVTAAVTDVEEPRDSEETRKAESEVEDKADDQAEDQAEDQTEEQAVDQVPGQLGGLQLRIAPRPPQNDSHEAKFRARAQERAQARVQAEIDDGNQAVLSLK